MSETHSVLCISYISIKRKKKIEKKRKGRNSKSVVTAADFIFSITSALHDSRNWERPR